jgi:predicted Zn finger-like uncharacterized protein
MIVQCPSCKTNYRVADELLSDATASFRCSRCKHSFELAASKTAENLTGKVPLSERLTDKAEKETELSFTFAASKKEEADEHATTKDATEDAPRFHADEPQKSFDNVDAYTTPQPFTASSRIDTGAGHAPQAQNLQKLPPSRAVTENILALDPYRDQPASTMPYLTLFALLVTFFGFATGFYVIHPDASEGFVKTIPLVGGKVLKNNHLKNGVALQSLRASYQTIQGNREVFVVTGVARNQNPAIIRAVRVNGQIYNLEGKEIEQQTIWIGNAISPRIIRGMTVQDISDLQRLKPLKSFEISPGDSIPFTIVFMKPPKTIKDFSCEVLTAEEAA